MNQETFQSTPDHIPYKIYLSEDELPKAWYNVRADMKNAHAMESAVPHWPAPVSVVTPFRPCFFA